jgi:hypothetical protein
MPRCKPGGTQATPSSTPTSPPPGTTDTTAAPGASALDAAQLRKLIDQANKGNIQAFDRLCALPPTAAAQWGQPLDLAENAREGFIRRASGEKALFTQELFRRQCTALTRDLTGPDPTPLETLLVDRIVLCWVHLHYVENIYVQAMSELSITQATFHQRRLALAQSRYLSAIRTLAQVRRLQVPAMQVNIADQQLNVAALAGTAPSHQQPAERTAR